MGIAHGLLVADVVHTRHRPTRNHFHYHVYYFCLPLQQIAQLARLWLVSLERFNLFSFYARDHAATPATTESWVRDVLAEWKITHADGEMVLLTLPRVLGYVFNPVSFWFCCSKNGELACVLSEVRNTFGERHCYLSYHEDGRMIGADDWLESRKLFHVSPFLPVAGSYRFRFVYRDEKIGVWIDHHDADGLLLSTALTGKRRTLNDAALLWCFVRYPLVTFKVIGLIHYQALKLVLKGIRYRRKPAPPTTEVSR
ncbi:MAG: DUF1365 domain-containing protein [Pseudomonadota bacterium]